MNAKGNYHLKERKDKLTVDRIKRVIEDEQVDDDCKINGSKERLGSLV